MKQYKILNVKVKKLNIMKTIFVVFSLMFLMSCSYMEKVTKQTIDQTVTAAVDRTARKVQNKVETKVEKTVDKILSPSKPIKRKSETDSTSVGK